MHYMKTALCMACFCRADARRPLPGSICPVPRIRPHGLDIKIREPTYVDRPAFPSNGRETVQTLITSRSRLTLGEAVLKAPARAALG
jgi:hypothetical protein